MKINNLIAAVIICATLPSCATIIRGTNDTVSVNTTPQGATVRTDLGFEGVSPTSIKAKRKKTYTITVEKEGYQPESRLVESKFNGGWPLAGNILLGGLIGLAVDLISGAPMGHEPESVTFELKPVERDLSRM